MAKQYPDDMTCRDPTRHLDSAPGTKGQKGQGSSTQKVSAIRARLLQLRAFLCPERASSVLDLRQVSDLVLSQRHVDRRLQCRINNRRLDSRTSLRKLASHLPPSHRSVSYLRDRRICRRSLPSHEVRYTRAPGSRPPYRCAA